MLPWLELEGSFNMVLVLLEGECMNEVFVFVFTKLSAATDVHG